MINIIYVIVIYMKRVVVVTTITTVEITILCMTTAACDTHMVYVYMHGNTVISYLTSQPRAELTFLLLLYLAFRSPPEGDAWETFVD